MIKIVWKCECGNVLISSTKRGSRKCECGNSVVIVGKTHKINGKAEIISKEKFDKNGEIIKLI